MNVFLLPCRFLLLVRLLTMVACRFLLTARSLALIASPFWLLALTLPDVSVFDAVLSSVTHCDGFRAVPS